MYDYNYYGYNYTDPWYYALFSGSNLAISITFIAISIVAMYFIFEKAGEQGWKAIIPLYNIYILFRIAWGNGWYFLFLFIPIANIFFIIIMYVKLAKSFGRGGGFACGLIFLTLIFECILAFDSKIRYIGPDGNPSSWNAGNSSWNTSGSAQGSFRMDGQDADWSESRRTGTDPGTEPFFYCTNCGTRLERGVRYCPKCGKPQ